MILALQAGIPNEQLMLALEPESAAIFCKELTVTRAEGVEGTFLRAFDPGEKYIVLDLGGMAPIAIRLVQYWPYFKTHRYITNNTKCLEKNVSIYYLCKTA